MRRLNSATGYVCLIAIAASITACSSAADDDATPATGLPATAETVAHGDHGGDVPHGDHTAKYGGTVYMKGDLHFEVVLDRAGMHRVYFSDAVRAELPASTASEVTLTVGGPSMPSETLPAQVDEAGESWMAHGSALRGDKIMARVAFVTAGEPYWIDVPFLDGTK